jgi:hypothetical protein
MLHGWGGGQIHKLQMLMRMAEITKLEEYVKCSRRYDAVREEKLGLLTYNLASAESNMAPESEEASRKRLTVPRPAARPRESRNLLDGGQAYLA